MTDEEREAAIAHCGREIEKYIDSNPRTAQENVEHMKKLVAQRSSEWVSKTERESGLM